MGRQGKSRDPAGTSDSSSRIFLGRANCVVGLISVLWGILRISIAYDFFGIVLGVMGYALGARRLGAATVLISAAVLVFLLAVALA